MTTLCYCLTLTVSLFFASWLPTLALAANSSTQLDALLTDIYEFELAQDPVRAYEKGRQPTTPQRLRSAAQKDQLLRANKAKEHLAQLHRINKTKLREPEKISYAIMAFTLNNALSNYKFGTYQIPFTSDSGFHVDLTLLYRNMPFRHTKDYEYYLETLAAIPHYFDDNIQNMKTGIARGFTMPAAVLVDYEKSILEHAVKNPTDSAFLPL